MRSEAALGLRFDQAWIAIEHRCQGTRIERLLSSGRGTILVGIRHFIKRGQGQGQMRPAGIAVDLPSLDDLTAIAEIEEPVLVEAFISASDQAPSPTAARISEISECLPKKLSSLLT